MGKVTMDFYVGETSVQLIEEGDRICGHVRAGNLFEPETLASWAHMIRMAGPGTVIDVGGYTGLFSIAAAKMGCRVICFEPMPRNAARILENCRINSVSIELYQEVASSQIGYTELTYNPRVEGLTSGASLIRKKGPKMMVRARTIDSLNVEPIAIKIDVERGESLVLQGAQRTITQHRPAMLVEVLDEEREKLVRDVFDTYRVSDQVNYRVAQVTDVRNWVMLPC